jgi:2-dehydro-3-deoxygluconokinase
LKTVVTFGEIMLRLSPPEFLRIDQAQKFDATFGGGEANVAVSLARFGLPAEYVTRLPENDLGDACAAFLRKYGVGTTHIQRGGERLGIYFLEFGAAQRGSKVIYDRAHSSLATIQPGMVRWDKVFAGAGWFHWTGITPAVSAGAAETLQEGLLAARNMGLTISCDLNYRKNLWKWGKKAGEVMPALVSLCDLVIGNEEDAEKVFGIEAPHSDITGGRVAAEQYLPVCQSLYERFPGLKRIAITLRGSLSASHNTWSGALWDGGTFYTAPQYEIAHIVDRVGGGDAFAAGLIYGLHTWQDDPESALRFAVAASCLKHSIWGDFNLVSRVEVETLMKGDASGRVSR